MLSNTHTSQSSRFQKAPNLAIALGLALLAPLCAPLNFPVIGLQPAVAGWSWKLPPDAVKLDSGRRNNVFFVGQPVTFTITGAAARYEVRDYDGEIVDKGMAGQTLNLAVKTPGWYKLYVYKTHDPLLDGPVLPPVKEGPEADKTAVQEAKDDAQRRIWGDIVGTTTFVIFRPDAHFPTLPSQDMPGGYSYPSIDQPMRGVTGMGPQRYALTDFNKMDEQLASLDKDVAVDEKMYLPFDPYRKRVLFLAFPNGTKGHEAQITQIVAHFKGKIDYFEPRNEPNGGSNGTDFANNEMKPFYDAVKAGNPNAKVMGPGTVSVGPMLMNWLNQFFEAGGANMIDAFSFHVYNGINGDLEMGHWTMDNLNAMLKKYGADKKEKWQTEQGYMAAVYGSYQPRLQGRWTMDEMMLFEQYGLPKEHNHLWYDKSHGFWDVPTWWENDDGGLNPAAPLMRVMSEELYGTRFVKAYDFGDPGNKIYIGSLFGGPGKWVAAFQSAGSTRGQVELAVKGGNSLKLVSAFGVESTLPVTNGTVTLPVPEIPVYVELARGQVITALPTQWGANLARMAGVTVTSSVPPDLSPKNEGINDIAKINNGELENWYYAQKPKTGPWTASNPTFPASVDINFPAPQSVSRVVVYAAPPWQGQSTLTDFEVQYDDNGNWVTLDHVVEPTKTFNVYSPPTRTSVDSFFSDRWLFPISFKPVTTSKIRLLVHMTTYGGGATKLVPEAGGQASGTPDLVLREIEVYGK